jgi:hypothetical protein
MLSYLHEGAVEAGCDEAGRGPLAGAVSPQIFSCKSLGSFAVLNWPKRKDCRSKLILFK